MPTLSSNRLDYLDAARAYALILGVIFHASLSFMPVFIGWAVMDVSTSSVVSWFLMISHSFRMELFFLIAGFFSHMSFHNQGLGRFAYSRLMRIAVPFVVGWFLLRPLLVSGWIIGGESMRGEANILNGIKAGFASLEKIPVDLFVGTHLWFLYYLLLISAAVILLRYLLGFYKPAQQKLLQIADAITAWLSSSNLAIFVLAIPTAGCLWFMSHWSVDTPDKTLVPHIPVLIVYGAFFFLGWLLHRQADWIEQFSRLSWSKFLLCVCALIATIYIYNIGADLGHPYYSFLKGSFVFCHAIVMWLLVSLTIGFFRRFFNVPSTTIRYLADSSYWLYLIHLPIVIFLQIAFAELPLHWAIKLLAVSGLTIAISILLYDVFVRPTFIGAILNGKAKQPGFILRTRQISAQHKLI